MSRSQRRIAELENALKPFAEVELVTNPNRDEGVPSQPIPPDATVVWLCAGKPPPNDYHLLTEDFRRARRVLYGGPRP